MPVTQADTQIMLLATFVVTGRIYGVCAGDTVKHIEKENTRKRAINQFTADRT